MKKAEAIAAYIKAKDAVRWAHEELLKLAPHLHGRENVPYRGARLRLDEALEDQTRMATQLAEYCVAHPEDGPDGSVQELEEHPEPKTDKERRDFLKQYLLAAAGPALVQTAKQIKATPTDAAMACIAFAAVVAKSMGVSFGGWHTFGAAFYNAAGYVEEFNFQPKAGSGTRR